MSDPTRADLEATIASLKAERDEALEAAKRAAAVGGGTLSLKVSEKGGVSLYGLGRFPVSLYRSQWERLVPFVKEGRVDAFIEANSAKLSVKGK